MNGLAVQRMCGRRTLRRVSVRIEGEALPGAAAPRKAVASFIGRGVCGEKPSPDAH